MATTTCCKGGVWGIDDIDKKYRANYLTYSGPATDPGCLFSIGSNDVGQLGVDTGGVQCYVPQQIPGTNWKTIKSGDNHGIATKTDNTLWTWGSNSVDGRLGDNSRTNRNSPVQVVGSSSWLDAVGTRYASYGIKTDGTLHGWGGLPGSFGNKSSPVSVSGTGSWCCIEAAAMAEVWLRNTSNCVYYFGEQKLIDPYVTFVDCCLYLLPGSWRKIASKGYSNQHAAFGIRTNCTLWAWGSQVGSEGSLGISFSYASCRGACSPVQIPGLWCDVGVVDSGNGGFGIRTNGDLYCWACSPVFLSSGWSCILPRSGSYGFVKCDGTQWSICAALNTSQAAPSGSPWTNIEVGPHTNIRMTYLKKF
jgi:hypothetical protein